MGRDTGDMIDLITEFDQAGVVISSDVRMVVVPRKALGTMVVTVFSAGADSK